MKYYVEIARYPLRYEVDADNEVDAEEKALKQFANETSESVYEVVSIEPEEERTKRIYE